MSAGSLAVLRGGSVEREACLRVPHEVSERRNEELPLGKKRTKNVVIETRLACVLRFRIGFLVSSLFPNSVSFNGYLLLRPIDEIALLCGETGGGVIKRTPSVEAHKTEQLAVFRRDVLREVIDHAVCA